MRKMIYFILFSMLLGIVLTRSDWVSPPGSGGGGDTYNNYYNVSGGNSTEQMIFAINNTGIYNINTTEKKGNSTAEINAVIPVYNNGSVNNNSGNWNLNLTNFKTLSLNTPPDINITGKIWFSHPTTPQWYFSEGDSATRWSMMQSVGAIIYKEETGTSQKWAIRGSDNINRFEVDLQEKKANMSNVGIVTNITSCTEALETDSAGRIQCGRDIGNSTAQMQAVISPMLTTYLNQTIKALSASYNTQNGTLVKNITALNFTVVANTYYTFEYMIVYSSNDTTNGVSFALTAPSTTFNYTWMNIYGVAAVGSDSNYESPDLKITRGTMVSTGSGSVAAINVPYIAIIKGTFLPTASGVLMPGYASEIGGCNITIYQGSTGMLTAVPAISVVAGK